MRLVLRETCRCQQRDGKHSTTEADHSTEYAHGKTDTERFEEWNLRRSMSVSVWLRLRMRMWFSGCRRSCRSEHSMLEVVEWSAWLVMIGIAEDLDVVSVEETAGSVVDLEPCRAWSQ